MLKMLFRLAGKPGNERGAQRDTGNTLAQFFYHLSNSGFRLLALHMLQHEIVRVLQRHVDVLDYLIDPLHGIHQLRGQHGRVVVEQTYPVNALHRCHRIQ